MNSERQAFPQRFLVILILAGVLTGTWQVRAQPTLDSVVPNDGASGVPTNTTIVFTFSEEMDPDATAADFFILSPFTYYTTTPSWNAGHTVLTCTPLAALPASKTIYWTLNGETPLGDPFEGAFGSFTTGTGSGGGGGGSGTNAITTFSVGKVHHYNQTSGAVPALDPLTPYGFSGVTALSSNRTATSATLTMPTSTVSNLTHLPPPSAEIFLMSPTFTSLSTFDSTFPSGDYSFFVQAASSNQTVVVNLPTEASMPQPGAPHLTNFNATQVVNPTAPFVLAWDAFPGGGANDYIDVDVGSFGSPNPGEPGALSGAATTFTIPAGTLLPNAVYSSRVGFFHFSGTTNSSYAADAYRATYTEFNLITTGGLVLTNPVAAPGNFSFEVLCSTGQTVTVEYRTNLAAGIWQNLLTTNSSASRFKAVSPQAATNRFLFFRARNGS